MVKAASVQAANEMPRVSNTVALKTPMPCSDANGPKNQENTRQNAQAATVTPIARSTSSAAVCRARPMPCVQVYRKVPVSSSLASTGAPAKAPSSAGTRFTRIPRTLPTVQSVLLNVRLRFWQASELAGWQRIRAV